LYIYQGLRGGREAGDTAETKVSSKIVECAPGPVAFKGAWGNQC
jgi:hypothetical protein